MQGNEYSDFTLMMALILQSIKFINISLSTKCHVTPSILQAKTAVECSQSYSFEAKCSINNRQNNYIDFHAYSLPTVNSTSFMKGFINRALFNFK